MRVPVPPIDWQRRPAALQARLQSCNQLSGLLVNRAFALEVVVMLGDSQDALPWNISPAQHILKKRNHLFTRLRSAERNNQNGIVVQIHITGHPSAYAPAKSTQAAKR